jgi:hypothetical protein
MQTSPAAQRLIGRFAWIMAWVGLVVGQLHALARHATDKGKEDLNQPLTKAWSGACFSCAPPVTGLVEPGHGLPNSPLLPDPDACDSRGWHIFRRCGGARNWSVTRWSKWCRNGAAPQAPSRVSHEGKTGNRLVVRTARVDRVRGAGSRGPTWCGTSDVRGPVPSGRPDGHRDEWGRRCLVLDRRSALPPDVNQGVFVPDQGEPETFERTTAAGPGYWAPKSHVELSSRNQAGPA